MGRAPISKRSTLVGPVLAFLVGLAVMFGLALLWVQRDHRATVSKVVAAAYGPPTTKSAGTVGLPRPKGWKLVGSRRDEIGGRMVTSATYVDGDRTLHVARPEGTENLVQESPEMTRNVDRGRIEVKVLPQPGAALVQIKRAKRTTLWSGTPASKAMLRRLTRLGVLAARRDG